MIAAAAWIESRKLKWFPVILETSIPYFTFNSWKQGAVITGFMGGTNSTSCVYTGSYDSSLLLTLSIYIDMGQTGAECRLDTSV